MKLNDSDVITLYTLKDADARLRAIRKHKRIKVASFILDVLDRLAYIVIWPLSIAALIYLFIH